MQGKPTLPSALYYDARTRTRKQEDKQMSAGTCTDTRTHMVAQGCTHQSDRIDIINMMSCLDTPAPEALCQLICELLLCCGHEFG